MRASTFIVLAAGVGTGLVGCITIPTGPPAQPTVTAKGPLSYVDRLKTMAVDKATQDAGGAELPAFITDSRNIACVFTSSRAGNLNQPWEPNNYTDSANETSPIVPVVNCELANYPAPDPATVKDTCAGTHVGYLGGTALLMPDAVSYGGCRAGVTAVEAAFGTEGTVSENMSRIPVLDQGHAKEAQGYRCAPLDDGVACANLSNGLGFFVSADKYELFGPGHQGPTTPAATAPATTAPASGAATKAG